MRVELHMEWRTSSIFEEPIDCTDVVVPMEPITNRRGLIGEVKAVRSTIFFLACLDEC
jgi:hypothetical protein